ncbi:hypothetical protein GCM10010988_15140 [Cnuibacter physcomitrellae]|nr:hypothetical protein GCM10010988_15140 [Cnuibacter physcomitrellae]
MCCIPREMAPILSTRPRIPSRQAPARARSVECSPSAASLPEPAPILSTRPRTLPSRQAPARGRSIECSPLAASLPDPAPILSTRPRIHPPRQAPTPNAQQRVLTMCCIPPGARADREHSTARPRGHG